MRKSLLLTQHESTIPTSCPGSESAYVSRASAIYRDQSTERSRKRRPELKRVRSLGLGGRDLPCRERARITKP